MKPALSRARFCKVFFISHFFFVLFLSKKCTLCYCNCHGMNLVRVIYRVPTLTLVTRALIQTVCSQRNAQIKKKKRRTKRNGRLKTGLLFCFSFLENSPRQAKDTTFSQINNILREINDSVVVYFGEGCARSARRWRQLSVGLPQTICILFIHFLFPFHRRCCAPFGFLSLKGKSKFHFDLGPPIVSPRDGEQQTPPEM